MEKKNIKVNSKECVENRKEKERREAKMGRWQDIASELETKLRLRTFPLAIKFMKKEEVEKVPKVRGLDHPYTFCQVVGLSRTIGWTISVFPENMRSACAHLLGLKEYKKEEVYDRVGVWFGEKEDAERFYECLKSLHVPFQGHEVVLVAPLASEKFEPDMILLHGTPAQMHLLLCAYLYKNYERYQFFFVGETSCVDTLAQAYITRKQALSIPCYGQRRYGHIREDELEIAIPPEIIDRGIKGLRWLWEKGLRYPIPHWGPETDPTPGLAVSYPAYRKT